MQIGAICYLLTKTGINLMIPASECKNNEEKNYCIVYNMG
jgi:hypothetical protein